MTNKKKNKDLISFLLTCSLMVILLVVGVHAASLTTIEPSGDSAVNYSFNSAGNDTTDYFSLPNTANVTSAVMNVSGFLLEWATENVVAVSTVHTTSIVQSSDGNIHISYYDKINGDLGHATYNGSWYVEIIDSADDVGDYCYMLEDINNELHICYFDTTNDDLKHANGTTGSWSTETVDSGANVGQYCSMIEDTNGELHIAYFNATGGDLKHANGTTGSWSTETVDSGANVGRYANIIEDVNGELHIVYHHFPPGNDDLKHANGTTGSWSTETVVSGGSVGRYANIIEDVNGELHIMYFNDTSDDLEHANGTTGSWSTEIIDSLGDVGHYISVIEDTNNELHVSYMHLGNTDLKHANGTTGSWSTEIVDSGASSGQMTDIIQSLDGNIHISYYESYGTDYLRHAEKVDAYVSAVKLDISNDGDVDWSYNQELNQSVSPKTTSDFTSELQNYIDNTCSTATCNIPINVTSGSAGIIQLGTVSIQYTNKPNVTSVSDTADPINVGSNVQFNTSFTDADGDQAAAYVCKSNAFAGGSCTGGQWCNSNNGSSPVSCTYTTQEADTTENYWVFAVDNTSLQSINNVSGTFEVNHRPNAYDLNVTPSTAYTNSTLTCNYSFNDTDSDSEGTSLFIWINDSGTMAGQTSSTLASANFVKDDNVSCGVKAQDTHSFYDDQYVNSSSIQINNLAPVVQEATSDDSSTASPTNVGSNVNFTVNATDQDGDTYELYVCTTNAFAAGTCTISEWCNSTDTASGVNASCEYTALVGDNTTEDWYSFVWDGTNYTASTSSDFEVNHRPNASAVTITPASPYTNDTLNCTYTFNDQDSDSENTSLRAFKWYNDTGNLNVNSQTLNSGNFSKLENLTCSILVYDEHSLNDSQYRNSTAKQILNSAPVINSNATVPSAPEYYNTTYAYANVTDLDSDISWVNFTITAPNGTAIVNNVNGTVAGDIWNSSNFNIDQYGTNWTVNITAGDAEGSTDSEQWTFGVNLGTLTPNPASKTYSQQAGATEAVNFSFSHNGTSYNTVDIGLEGNLSNISRFTSSYEEDPFNVSVGDTKYVQINITSNNSLADATYTGNITLNRTNDGTIYRIPYTVSIATEVGIIDLVPTSKATSMVAGGSESWVLTVSNTGNRDLEHCNLSATGDLTSFTAFDQSDFTVNNVTPFSVSVQYSTAPTGTQTGTVVVDCVATDYGGLDQELVDPVVVTVAALGAGGGGSGAGNDVTKICDIQLPEKITISTARPVEKIKLKNNEDFSIIPLYSIKDIYGKPSATLALSIDIPKTTVPPKDSIDIILTLNPSKIEGNETRYSKLVVSAIGCRDIETEVEVIIGERKTSIQYLDDITNWLYGYLPFLKTTAFEIGETEITWTYVLVLTSILLMLVFYAFTKNMLHSFGGTAAIIAVIILLIKYSGGL